MAAEGRTTLRAARRIAAGGALGILLLVAIVYLARTFVFSWLAELYLLSRGVPSSVDISRMDWSGLDARVRLGARRTPDFATENVHAVFNGDWVPQIRSLTLSHSVLRVAFDGEKLSFGTLQRLVDSFTAAARAPVVPGSERQAPLRIVLQDAKVLGFTPAGVVSLAGGAVIADGRIERASGNIGRANLRAPGFALLLSGGSFSARDDVSGLTVHAGVRGHGVMFEHVRAGQAQLSLDLLGLRWGNGRLSLSSANANLRAQAINGRGLSASRADARFKLGAWQAGSARASGSVDGFVDLAQLRTDMFNAAAVSQHLQSQNLVVEKAGSGWRASGPVSGETKIAAGRYRFKSAPLVIASLAAQTRGEANAGGGGVAFSLSTSLQADLAMSPGDARKFAKDIPLLGDDPHNVHAMVSALRGVKLAAADIRIARSSGPVAVTLAAPVTLVSRSGAHGRLVQSGDAFATVAPDGRMAGGFAAMFSGGGLPSADLRVSQFSARQKPDGLVLDSTLSLSTRASLRSLRDVTLATSGQLKAAHGQYAFVPEGCAKLGLGAYLSDGAATLSKLRTQICALPQHALLSSTENGWRLQGMWRNLVATLDAANARAASTGGRLDIAGDGNGLTSGFVESARARLTDAKAARRFAPLLASGRIALRNAQWRGTIGVVIASSGRKLATVNLHHDLQTGSGEALIVSDMMFAPEGLQPGEISPLLASLVRAQGAAEFRGRLAWNAQGHASGGTLSVRDADFSGPLGAVKQASTQIVFTSLRPLATASAQTLTAQKIDWLVPFSDLVLTFQFAEDALRVDRFEAAAANGHVALAPMVVAFDPNSVIVGALKLENVNLSALIAASNLADKVSLDAPVTGEIPFSYGPKGLRVTNGHFMATGPARLSIKRTVWTGGEAAQTDAIRDFAYQALENLAIDALDARLNSLPAGRLGVVFHIKGRNDPAVAQETRIGVMDLIQGHAFDKPLPLPKGTPVDLTLDTSLNFDELLDAYRHAFSADVAGAAAASEQSEGKLP